MRLPVAISCYANDNQPTIHRTAEFRGRVREMWAQGDLIKKGKYRQLWVEVRVWNERIKYGVERVMRERMQGDTFKIKGN